jgi:hypothetical protein
MNMSSVKIFTEALSLTAPDLNPKTHSRFSKVESYQG